MEMIQMGEIDVISNGDKSKYYIFIKTPMLDDKQSINVIYDPQGHNLKVTACAIPMLRMLHRIYPDAPYDYRVFQNSSHCGAYEHSIHVPVSVPRFRDDNMLVHILYQQGIIMLEVEPMKCVDVPIVAA